MKTTKQIQFQVAVIQRASLFMFQAIVGLILMTSTLSSQATIVTLKANDAGGTTSITGSTNWDNNAVASAGNTYFTTNRLIRTPLAPGTYNFGGDSLTVGGNGFAAVGRLLFKGTNTIVNIGNVGGLILNGGLLDMAVGTSITTNTLGGTINVIGNSFMGSGAPSVTVYDFFNITATISGSGNLQLNGALGTFAGTSVTDQGPVQWSAANPYSGILTVSGAPTLPTLAALILNNLNAVSNATVNLTTTGANPGMSFASGANIGLFNIGMLSGTTTNLTLTDTAGGAVAISVGANNTIGNFSGVLSGKGSLTVTGAGSLILSGGANTYTGNTTVSAGTLALSGSASIVNSTNITVSHGATLDVSAVSFTLGGSQNLFNGGTVSGSVDTTSGTKIYAGADDGYGTNVISGNLTLEAGALCYIDVGRIHNGSNDLVSVGGTLSLNNNVFHFKAPSTSVSLETADYTILTSPNPVSGTVSPTPVWDVAPLNSANFSVVISGNNVLLHYTASTPPSGTGSASPSTVARNQSTALTVAVIPGSNPISSVTVSAPANFTPTSVTLVRSNSSALYTNSITVTAGASFGINTLSFTITDTGSLTGGGTFPVTIAPANDVWNGGGSDNNWSTGGNWVGGNTPLTDDNVAFAGSTRLTPNLDTSYTIGSLTFSNNAGSFVIGTGNGSTLTLDTGLTNNSPNLQTLTVPITLNGNPIATFGSLQIGDPATLDGGSYNGSITNNGAFIYNSTAAQTLGGTISGSGSLTNSSTGTLTLSGVNTFTGGTTVSGVSTLALASTAGAGTGVINLLAGSTLTPAIGGNATATNTVVVNGSVNIVPSVTSSVLGGLFTGSGTLNVNTSMGIFNFGGTGAGTQFTNFSGTIELGSSTGILKFRNDSGAATDKGMGNLTLDLGIGSATLINKTANTGNNSGNGTQTIGALIGGTGTILDAADFTSTNIYTYVIGGLGGNTEFDGIIQNSNGTNAIVKVGSGTWTLGQTETYSGSTVVSNGTLALANVGNGDPSIDSSPTIVLGSSTAKIDVSRRSDGTLFLGNSITQSLNGIGTLNGSLTESANSSVNVGLGILNVTNVATLNGALVMQLNRTNAFNASKLVAGSLVNASALTVTNIGPALQGGDTFQLFKGPVTGFTVTNLPTLTGSMYWTNKLAINGSLAVVNPVNANPPIVRASYSGGVLSLSWPTNAGWTLQQQTNSLSSGLGTNWVDVPGSANITSTNIVVDPTKATVFYRLRL